MREEDKRLTDEELIDLLRENGDGEIEEFLLSKYKELVRAKAYSMFILGGDHNDLSQEGMIGLLRAIRRYDSGRDASFATFAELCVSRQIYSAIRSAGNLKNYYLNQALSLEGFVRGNGDEGERRVIDILNDKLVQDPESHVIDRENVRQIQELIGQELSSFEKEVLELYITGMTTTQIAGVLGKGEKSTDNALQRVKNKLKKVLADRL